MTAIEDAATKLGFGVALADLAAARITIAPTPNAIGSELVINGSFTGNADGWTLESSWSYGGNKVTKATGGSFGTGLEQEVGADDGKLYRVVFDVSGATVFGLEVRLGNAVGLSGVVNGTNTVDIICGFSTGKIRFQDITDAFDGSIDNVSVKELIAGSCISLFANNSEEGLQIDGGLSGGNPARVYAINGDIYLKSSGFDYGSVGIVYPYDDSGNTVKLCVDNITDFRNWQFPDSDGTFASQSSTSGTFTSQDGKTITVTKGIITGISGP